MIRPRRMDLFRINCAAVQYSRGHEIGGQTPAKPKPGWLPSLTPYRSADTQIRLVACAA
jgi:hypothetical protein